MLFKHQHLLHELRRTGVQATADILSVTTLGGGGSLRALWASDEDLSSRWLDVRLKLRVVPPNTMNLPFEATVLTRVHTLKLQGGKVLVWYDPTDTSRLVVDYEADLERHQHFQAEADHYRAESEMLSHRYEQRPGLAWTPVAGRLLPVQAALGPGHGRILTGGPLGELLAAPAQAAVAAVRDRAGELLPQLAADWFARHDLRFDQPYGNLPDGAGPADAAGTTVAAALALVSLLSGRIVRTETAVTGALGPDGALVAVAGLKRAAAGAGRGHATRLLLPAANEADGQRLADKQRQGLDLVFAATLAEAVRSALAKHPVKGHTPPV
ncbi:S16 family serine protease [Kitasatospora viridis]|uniref:Lon protease-like protein n=1 Tax=Kitasatospora viridis TaxID=281105 RepID=A0A561T6P3_9ACTN|nr:S16 family serine protease [Kitasatospora viridis]TWF82791.1 Lon protease-like protein [Kitasatospora viridis]